MSNTYETFKKYSVNDVTTVEEFCNKYYKYDRFKGRGEDYMSCVIESNIKDLEKDGICFITHHDSVTGEVVSFIKNKFTNEGVRKMKIEFEAKYLDTTIGGNNNYFEVELDEWMIEDMTKEELEKYTKRYIYDYIERYILQDMLKDISVNIKK